MGRPGLRAARRVVLRGKGRAPGNGCGDEAGALCRSEMIAPDLEWATGLRVDAGFAGAIGCGRRLLRCGSRLGK